MKQKSYKNDDAQRNRIIKWKSCEKRLYRKCEKLPLFETGKHQKGYYLQQTAKKQEHEIEETKNRKKRNRKMAIKSYRQTKLRDQCVLLQFYCKEVTLHNIWRILHTCIHKIYMNLIQAYVWKKYVWKKRKIIYVA